MKKRKRFCRFDVFLSLLELIYVLREADISKTINGKYILSNVSMDMQGRKIYGICGKNGSGKSMLFREIQI
ncbi:MAG: ATP-binding cassette domain-containing protein [Lachnospiraceae bacterium]|nr:ATP-binding cassette domain-containing protein [Lachnospiraceae bacterium]